MAEEKENVRGVLATFTSMFTNIFQQCVEEYYVTIENGLRKSGKCVELITNLKNHELSPESVKNDGAKADSLLIRSIGEGSINGKKYNELKMIFPVYMFKNNAKEGLFDVIKAGMEIFRLFEWQIMEVMHYDVGNTNIIKLIAEDAVDRVLYIFTKQETSTVFSSDRLVEGVLHGRTKTIDYENIPHMFQLACPRLPTEVFSCVGVQTIDTNGLILARYIINKSEGTSENKSFRLNYARDHLSDYTLVSIEKATNYTYSFNAIDKQNVTVEILKTTNNTIKLSEETKKRIRRDAESLVRYLEWETHGNVLFGLSENVKGYVEREGLIPSIEDGLSEGLVVLFGQRGVGKSELARRFANIMKNFEINVMWINCLTTHTIRDSFQRLANLISPHLIGIEKWDIDRNLDFICDRLCLKSNVIIFDDAPSLAAIENIIFRLWNISEETFKILVTSNAYNWRTQEMTVKTIKLENYTNPEAEKFVSTTLKSKCTKEEAKLLVEKLQNQPLALKLATACIARTNKEGWSSATNIYLRDYEKWQFRQQDFDLETGGFSKAMYRTLEMAIEKIRHHRWGEKAVEVLSIMPFLLPSGLLRHVFLGVTDNDEEMLNDIVTLLKTYVDMKTDGEKWTVHELILDVRRFQIQKTETCEKRWHLGKYISKTEEEIVNEALKLLKTSSFPLKPENVVCAWNYAYKYKKMAMRKLVLSGEYIGVSCRILMAKGNDEFALALAQCYASSVLILRIQSKFGISVCVPIEEANRRNNLKITQILFNAYKNIYCHWIYDALSQNNLETANWLIKQGAAVAAVNSQPQWFQFEYKDKSPLHWAIQENNFAMFRTLHKAGADLNTSDSIERITCAHLAVQKKHTDIANYIFLNGGNVNAKDFRGQTPVHYAVANNHQDTIKCSIANKGDVNAKDNEGRTPVHYAVESDHQDTVKYLIENGGDVNAKDEYGMTPLHKAATHKCDDVLKCLIDNGGDINMRDCEDDTPLHYAAKYGKLNTLKYLVSKGCDANAKNHLGDTPVHIAAKKGDNDALQYLKDNGGNINAKNEAGETPMHCTVLYAAKNHLSLSFMFLIDNGADVNVQDNTGEAPLHHVARKCYNEHGILLRYLIDKGADVNRKNHEGETAMHYAAKINEIETIKYLMENGGDVGAKDNNGRTPMFYSAKNSFSMLFDFIKKEGDIYTKNNDGKGLVHLINEKGLDCQAVDNFGRTPLHYAAEKFDTDELIKYLVMKKGVDVNLKDMSGKTPLHYAITARWFLADGGFGFTKLLIDDFGADFNAEDTDGCKPLHYAAMNGCMLTVNYLVKKKRADVNVKDNKGKTPLHYAVADTYRYYPHSKFNWYKGHEFVELLVELGADFSVKDNEGYTPLHLAAEKGRLAVVKYLVNSKGADVNARTCRGDTPLALAKNGNVSDFLVKKTKRNE